MPYIKPTDRKYCINSDIADLLLMRQEEFPCEPYDEPYYKKVDKKFQTKTEIYDNFWLGCETVAGCSDSLRDDQAPYEAWLGVDKYYLENIFKYSVTPNDLPYEEPQFAYKDNQWVQYKDIFGAQYHFTINGLLQDTWVTHYYAQTNKAALPTPGTLNKNFTVTSFKNRVRSTYTDDYETAKANAPAGCEHYTVENDKVELIYHHGILPLNLMYKSATSWRQDSFPTSEEPFHATANPTSYVIPSSEESTKYDTDIVFTLPEYSGLTEVNYTWNIRQIESGLTLKAIITQRKKTGTVSFVDGDTITLEGIGSEGPKGVKPSKGLVYTGDYKDGVNDTISWYNRTNNISPDTGDFTDETHVDSSGLDDTVSIPSTVSWLHDVVYNINQWQGFADWWKEGEGQTNPRETTITINKKDPRLDIVDPDSFIVRQNPPVVKYCYYFEGLKVEDIDCHGGELKATVEKSYRDVYHDYSLCDDGFNDYYVREEPLEWSISPSSVTMNQECREIEHTIVATQEISNLTLTVKIKQGRDCETIDYIRNCEASPSSVGADGGSVSISADALYYVRKCVVVTDDSSYTPITYSVPANTGYSSKTISITVSNANGSTCTAYVTQAGQPMPSGCNVKDGYQMDVSVSPSSVDCDGGTVTVTVSTCKKLASGTTAEQDVSWTVSPGGGSGTGSGTATVSIGATDSDKTTTITVSSEAGSCDLNVTQSGCGSGPGPGPDPGEGDCSCPCELAIHTDENINNIPSGGWSFDFFVWQSCDNCVAQSWTLESSVDWITFSKTSGPGNCCATYNCGDPTEGEGERECLEPARNTGNVIRMTVAANPNTTARDATLTFRNACGQEQISNIHQNGKSPEPVGISYWYMFTDKSDRQIPASGVSGKEEALTLHVSPDGETCSSAVISNVKETGNSPSGFGSSALSWDSRGPHVTYSVPANTTTSTRSFLLTVYPNVDEKASCGTNTLAATTVHLIEEQTGIEYDSKGEVFADYNPDDKAPK